MLSRNSAVMPIPVSVTEKRKCRPLSMRSMLSMTEPCSVNFSALPIRLMRIWRIRAESPHSWSGRSAAIRALRARPLLRAWLRNMPMTPSTSACSEKSLLSISRWPASRREKSRMLLISSSRYCEESQARPSNSFWSGLRRPILSMSSVPITPFSGVRISWLTVAAKSALSLAKRRALSRAVRSSRSRCSSASIMLLKACAMSDRSRGPERSARRPVSPLSARAMVSERSASGWVRRRASRRRVRTKNAAKAMPAEKLTAKTSRTSFFSVALLWWMTTKPSRRSWRSVVSNCVSGSETDQTGATKRQPPAFSKSR